ncbi:response regulator [Halosquirtibacter xylanolyticus]|uniref:two-component regulator propeller domain-containing protein n=1 Tax=Halosquirtibacter xylanolyticus TaxID=3374599 RepID=UPI0037496420|nr:response regulator [Prolixibacteraceae bacterium]
MRIQLLFILSIVYLIFQTAYAQNHIFEHLNVSDGLTQSSVISMEQDSVGYIWLGTRNGLNRYDGTEIKQYHHLRGDSTSVLGENVKQIIASKESSDLYVLVKQGVSVFRYKEERFYNYVVPHCETIYLDSNTLFIGDHLGLGVLDLNTGNVNRVSIPGYPDFVLNKIYMDQQGRLWLATRQYGLLCYDPNSKVVKVMLNKEVTSIMAYQGSYMVGTASDGVYLLSEHGVLKHFHEKSKKYPLSNNTIRSVCRDPLGNVWIGTFYGLNVWNPSNNKIDVYYQSDLDPNGLSHNSIYSILVDKQGSVWIGSYFGGVNIYNPRLTVFKYFKPNQQKNTSINYRVVGDILQGSGPNLWIATEGGGLNLYNTRTRKFEYFIHNSSSNSISHNNIKALFFDHNRELWVGTHNGGVNRMNMKTKTFKVYNSSNSGLKHNSVSAIAEWQGRILVGNAIGLFISDENRDEFTSFLDRGTPGSPAVLGTILHVMVDSKDRLWAATESNGLFMYDESKAKVYHFTVDESNPYGLPSNHIPFVYEDNNSRVWIATSGGGLCRYLEDGSGFDIFNKEKDGISSDFIFTVAQSRYGFLWVATSNGISRLDVKGRRFTNFDHGKGFPLGEINEKSLCVTRNGEVYVGGIQGLVSFKEKDLIRTKSKRKVLITEAMIRTVDESDGVLGIHETLLFKDKIKIAHQNSGVTFSFTSFEYIKSFRPEFEYMLEGYDDHWVQATYLDKVTYNRLSSGHYIFKVRVANDSDLKYMDSVVVVVGVPFYATWWAYLLYFLFLVLALYGVHLVLVRKSILEVSLEQQKLDAEKLMNDNANKLQFFTNISHEFRTPLTIISGLIEKVLSNDRLIDGDKRSLNSAFRNCQRMTYLVDEILDFRKQELGVLTVHRRSVDFVSFVKHVFDAYEQYAIINDIRYEFVANDADIACCIDPKQFKKIVHNLLSNAFKYRSNNAIIRVIVFSEADNVVLKIIDNGLGIEKDHIDKIFDRYFHVEGEDTGGTGIGLSLVKGLIEAHGGQISVESNPGEGSCFQVVFPKKLDACNGDGEFLKEWKDDIVQQPILLSEQETEEDVEEPIEDSEKPSVLVVDDNKELRDLLQETLSSYFNVFVKGNGKEAYEWVMENRPDIIISDVMMPVMNGFEFTRLIKQDESLCHIPIVLLTAKDSREHYEEGISAGADDYIVKPFEVGMLSKKINNILLTRSALQRQYSSDPEFDTKILAKNDVDKDLLKRAREVVEANINNHEFSVNDFAREMCLGRTSLYDKIKGVTGQTPNDFIMSTRLKTAAHLLRTNRGMNVSEVAYTVGFSTPRYFSKCFSKHFGVPPKKYAKQFVVNSDSE